MSTATTNASIRREPELLGQTVVVIGGSAGIGLETARRARAEGARLILTGRNPERLQFAASELEALSTTAFDATDPVPLKRFFGVLPGTIDHVMVAAGQPHYGRLLDMDVEQARSALNAHLLLMLEVARNAANKVRPGGTLLFIGGTGGRRPGVGMGLVPTVTAALPALTTSLALELAPSVSTLSRPASSTHRCRHRYSVMSSTTAAISFARRFLSGGSSHQPMLLRWPCTS
jgi:NAD(P)-dependent dehydrogenase (short-subunit alcohol dehydrogenase family)